MNLDKNSYELYRNGIYEKYDDSINPILFNHVPVDENKYVPANWVYNRNAVKEVHGKIKYIPQDCFNGWKICR